MKKKKKGMSLILVIMMFSILSLIGISVLTLTASAYRKTIVDNTVKKNRYFSEAGLDIASGLIGKEVEVAIDQGNKEVDGYVNTLNGEDGIIAKEKDRVKEKLPAEPERYDYQKADGGSEYVNNDLTANEEYIKEKKEKIFKATYEQHIVGNIKDLLERGEEGKDSYKLKEGSSNKPMVLVKNTEYVFNNANYNGKTESVLKLEIESAFTENKIQKKIAVDYNIITPSYANLSSIKSTKVTLYKNPVWSKAICMDGDFLLKGAMEVYGDVYVKGNNRGIAVNCDATSILLKGEVATAKALEIDEVDTKGYTLPTVSKDKKKDFTLEGNLYAANIKFSEKAAYLKGNFNGSVYTNNDLALNSSKTDIRITKGLFGINDINNESLLENKSKISSSIYVNSSDIGNGSTITILDKLILMGTAYIKTNPSYQTGESVAIKGNYLAYAYPLNSDEAKDKGLDEKNVLFDYYEPLTIVKSFNNDTPLNVFNKANYFNIFSKEENKNIINLGNGIVLPEDYTTVGAMVSGGSVHYKENTIEALTEKVASYRENYGINVYAMGDSYNTSNLYNNGVIAKSVATQINFNNAKNVESKKTLAEGFSDILYINGSNKNYVLKGAGNPTVPSGLEVIDLSSTNGKGKGIIITNGDVYLAGNIDFRGTIISLKNIEALDSLNKNIIYDDYVVKKKIAINYYDYFQNLFVGNSVDSENIEAKYEVSTENNDENSKVGSDIVRNNLVKLENWRIIK